MIQNEDTNNQPAASEGLVDLDFVKRNSKFAPVARKNYGCERRRLDGLVELIRQGKKREWEACLVARDTRTNLRAFIFCQQVALEYDVSLAEISNETVLKIGAIRDKHVKELVIQMVKNSVIKDCDPFDESVPLDRKGITTPRLKAIIARCTEQVEKSKSQKNVVPAKKKEESEQLVKAPAAQSQARPKVSEPPVVVNDILRKCVKDELTIFEIEQVLERKTNRRFLPGEILKMVEKVKLPVVA